MCGIAASVKAGNEGKVQKATVMQAYRGTRMAAGDMLGHVRLPIVGLGEENDQPIEVPGGWRLAFTGELLDFRQRDPRLACDLELVARTWAIAGPSGFRTNDGFWAIVAVREDQRQLHMLCDYLAQKPLYYRLDEAACATELDACASFGPVTPDRIYLSDCCKWGYCPDPRRTPFAEISRVQPGEYVAMDDRGNISRHVVDPLYPIPCHEGELRREFEEAVARRVLSSDVPVACLLSGGFDSSLVYALASRVAPVQPYFVGGDSLEGDAVELEDACLVVDHAIERLREELGSSEPTSGIPEFDPSLLAETFGSYPNPDPAPTAARDAYEARILRPLKVVGMPGTVYTAEALEIMQEPIDLGSLLPQVVLSRAVGESVCLTGDGADEFFGGYGRALRYDSQASDVFRELVCWHLPRLDRVMMRQRVEVRSPFLARRVCQMALGLPRELRTGKAVLRREFADVLPERIVRKGKVPLRTLASKGEGYREGLVEEYVRRRWP